MADVQEDVYVRKDVFDARMDRMEMLLEKTVLEIKSYVDKSTGELKTYVEKATNETKAEIAEVKNEVRALTTRVDVLEQKLDARISAVENMLTWWIALFAAVIALTALLPPVLAFIKKMFKPSCTPDEVRNIIKAELASLSGGGE